MGLEKGRKIGVSQGKRRGAAAGATVAERRLAVIEQQAAAQADAAAVADAAPASSVSPPVGTGPCIYQANCGVPGDEPGETVFDEPE